MHCRLVELNSIDTIPQSIDPFSSSYWQAPVAQTSAGRENKQTLPLTSMKPPRLPLQARPNGALNGVAASDTIREPSKKPATKAAKRQVPEAELAAFRDAVNGSTLTKVRLVEELKRK